MLTIFDSTGMIQLHIKIMQKIVHILLHIEKEKRSSKQGLWKVIMNTVYKKPLCICQVN